MIAVRQFIIFTYAISIAIVLPIESHVYADEASAAPLRIDVPSQRSYEDTVQHLQWRFGEYGLVISWASNYKDVLRKTADASPKVTIFEVIQSPWLEQIYDTAPNATLAIPFRISVIEQSDGAVLVSYLTPSRLLASEVGSSLESLGATIDAKIARIVRLATAVKSD